MIMGKWYDIDENNADFNEVVRISGFDLDKKYIGRVIVMYDDDVPAGAGRLLLEKEIFVIDYLYVSENHRKNGIGDLALRMLIRKAFDSLGNAVYTAVPATLFPFFLKLGFKPCDGLLNKNGTDFYPLVCVTDVGGHCGGK
ncbi:hypothetical protein SDC9_134193 [bioreactor metagenome]|uniref:N-acetyltransferase domain-containing protein n=1 Tax=bioreactor metagenome TaxID=1076179 RepID=A0A645DC88_9ZZZZ|nr:GNAT family N-acetyltransferase [Lachnospiraceae bacterium]